MEKTNLEELKALRRINVLRIQALMENKTPELNFAIKLDEFLAQELENRGEQVVREKLVYPLKPKNSDLVIDANEYAFV